MMVAASSVFWLITVTCDPEVGGEAVHLPGDLLDSPEGQERARQHLGDRLVVALGDHVGVVLAVVGDEFGGGRAAGGVVCGRGRRGRSGLAG
jgi:hypothetical protein